jgi:Zn-dependent peptidase ImmA (M78 family)/transcriptional regulator with XRE-family HTH domain
VELASAVGVTATAIAQYERGHNRPSQSVVNELALFLGLPREFFGAGRPIVPLTASEAHFRSLRSTTAAAREQALAFGELTLAVVDLVSGYVDLPAVNLPEIELPAELSDSVITEAARATRAHWGYPNGPLPSVVDLLEANGVVTVRLPDDVDRKVSAFSTYSGNRPLVLLAQGREDRARSRFDAAHELGHVLLHPDSEPGSKIAENQANTFAAELLMPGEEILGQLPRRIDWATFHQLKRAWGVSLRALVYRAHALGVLSEASYRRANQQLSIWGYPEPGDLGLAESPRLLGLVRQVMEDNDIDFHGVLARGGIVGDVANQIVAAGSAEKPRIQF